MLMLNFTLTDLRYLLALAEEKHFAKAADKCFVSQPTLSIAIKKLEDNFGVIIFERQNHQILITDSGRRIIAQAEIVLAQAKLLQQLAMNSADPYAEPLKIGAIFTIGPYLFPKLVQQVTHSVTQLKLIIEENYTDRLISKLLSGEIDIAILATEEKYSELNKIDLFNEELHIICSNKHSLANQKMPIKQEQLNQETILLLGSGHCLRDQIIEACNNAQQHNHIFGHSITTSSLETIKYMVEMNLGLSILPQMAEHNLSSQIVVKQFGQGKSIRTISMYYRKNFPREILVEQLATIIQQFN